MAIRRQNIRLQKDEENSLRALYREFNITTDDYPHRPDDLQRLVDTFNRLTGRIEVPTDVLRYMITKRKKGQWERLGHDGVGKPEQPAVTFSEEDTKHLNAIHEELQVSSDNYVLDADAARRLQDEFARRTGRIIPPMILAAAMISQRKAGELATLRPKADDQDLGFTDIDDVAQ